MPPSAKTPANCAASELVRKHGFDGASAGIVMKAVGLTRGGLYAHFPDKTAMLTAAMARALVPTVARFKEFVADARAADDRAQVAKTYLSDFYIAHPSKGCAAAALVSEMARQNSGNCDERSARFGDRNTVVTR